MDRYVAGFCDGDVSEYLVSLWLGCCFNLRLLRLQVSRGVPYDKYCYNQIYQINREIRWSNHPVP